MKRLMISWVVAAAAVLLGWIGVADADSAALRSCAKALTKQGEAYLSKRRDLIDRCVERMLKCELLLEIKQTNPDDCRAAAIDSCQSHLEPGVLGLARLAPAYDSQIARYCAPADFASVLALGAGGLWFSSDVDCGASADLAGLGACIRSALDESMEIGVGELLPRAGLLLDQAGVGASFPHVPRPPLVDVTIAATSASSGTLVSPGTIAISAGDVVRIVGDGATLPCGNGTNGMLEVRILSAGAACSDIGSIVEQFSIDEPYGTGRSGMAGPFQADATYCLTLNDGSCDDTVTGAIDVP